MRTFPFLSLVPLRIVSRISLSVVSSDHLALVKSGAFSLRPFSVSPRPSSPWQVTHLALVNSSFGSCTPGAIRSGGAVGACWKARESASAARDKGSSLRGLKGCRRSVARKGALRFGPHGAARLGRVHDLGRSGEGQHERDGVLGPRGVDGRFHPAARQAPRAIAIPRERPARRR